MPQSRPRIAITSRLAVTEAGGIESAVVEIARAIAACRPKWDVVCVHAFKRQTWFNHVPFLGDIVAAILIALRCRSADVVVLNGAEYAWPRMLRHRTRSRTVVVWHGTRVGEIPALTSRMSFAVRVYLWLETCLQWWALFARGQIAVSSTTIAELRAAYRTKRQLVLVPNGAPNIGKSTATGLPIRVAWLGTNAYKKGLDIAIKACRIARTRQPDLQLAVIGIDSNPELPGEPWVECIGRVDRTAALMEMQRCGIFLGTSRYEGCSVAVIEALALGMPVVAGPSVAWMIGEGGVEVTSYDPVAFARALVRLCDDNEFRARCVRETRKAALAFDWPTSAHAYAREIESCLQS